MAYKLIKGRKKLKRRNTKNVGEKMIRKERPEESKAQLIKTIKYTLTLNIQKSIHSKDKYLFLFIYKNTNLKYNKGSIIFNTKEFFQLHWTKAK